MSTGLQAELSYYTNGNRKLAADYLGHSISNLTERVYVTTSSRIMEQSIRDFVI